MKTRKLIAIEGPIGVGKTSLARLLAERFESRLVLEDPDGNPYLQEYYRDPRKYAFLTQITFLFMRYEQLRGLHQGSLFHQGGVVCDFLFAKDRIFASVTLDEREWKLYDRISRMLDADIPEPDLVICLQASTDRLMENIQKRNRPSEEQITLEYLQRLQEAYQEFFFRHSFPAQLVINATNLDFIGNPDDLATLIDQIDQPFSGVRYFNPIGADD